MEDERKEHLEFAKQIAYKAGEIMLKYFNQKDISSYKGDKTIVTLADKEINLYLIEQVKKKYPNHSVDGEEEQFGKSNYVWVCDPVDGTAMYARHVPVAVFSLALVINGEPIVGVVYDPFTDSLYSAIKGEGAYKNEEKINVNNYKLEDIRSACHCDMWPKAKYNVFDVLKELSKITRLNDIGSITRASCLVATGDYTLTIFTGTEHKNCDIAAVKVIVEEAGGKVTNIFGEEQRYDKSIQGAIISNGIVHEEVVETLRKYLIQN